MNELESWFGYRYRSASGGVPAIAPAFAQTPTPVALNINGPPPPVAPDTARREDGKVTMRATRLPQPLRLDGRLDEEFYRSVPAVTGFIQTDPRPGQPATEQTDVWVFFDDRQLYISLRCRDSQPDRMVANERRCDTIFGGFPALLNRSMAVKFTRLLRF